MSTPSSSWLYWVPLISGLSRMSQEDSWSVFAGAIATMMWENRYGSSTVTTKNSSQIKLTLLSSGSVNSHPLVYGQSFSSSIFSPSPSFGYTKLDAGNGMPDQSQHERNQPPRFLQVQRGYIFHYLAHNQKMSNLKQSVMEKGLKTFFTGKWSQVILNGSFLSLITLLIKYN